MKFTEQLNRFLSRSHRLHLLLLSFLVVLSGLMEIAGIASIMPFMGAVLNPDFVVRNPFAARIFHEFHFSDANHFLIFLGLVVLGVLFVSNLTSALTNWNILRFSFGLGRDMSLKLLSSYLTHPYVFFLHRNSSDLVSNTLWEVGRIVNGIVIPLLTVYSRAVVSLAILGLLLWANPSLALMTGVTLGGAYLGIFFLVRKTLARSGSETTRVNSQRTQLAYETLGGIKDIKILGREKDFYDRFSRPVAHYATYQARSQMIALMPRYALETLAFGGIIVIVIYLLGAEHGASRALPMISLYALAGYRLMPALQQIFANVSSIRFNLSAVEKLSLDLTEAVKGGPPPLPAQPLPFSREISLQKIVFRYPERTEAVLNQVSLSIRSNTTVGIVGSTGSGKTTTLDILLGLLTPESGCLMIDGVPIGEGNLRNWQANIGYVPQQIMLLDDTVVRNIAFGIPDGEVDRDAVVKAAKLAHLHDFIIGDLPDGYDTIVGERGLRLSGGQRQRIGIARALYHDPAVLVLDEATSALDNITESVIMEALHTLSHQKTILMVAHRLSTVRECDMIFVMERGELADSGTYPELLSRNAVFRQLANETAGMVESGGRGTP
ncbi:MAG: ABC transporter ATP-binding protein [Nitrospirota bacterium]|nr:ABC transporter ATP-binding protein [Nitrospirota bacterium]